MIRNSEKPTPESLSWIEHLTESQIDAGRIKKLEGGTSSLVFEIPFAAGSRHESLILRLFHKKDWLEMEPDLAKHESESLRGAAGSSVPSPQLIAFDETGERCGMPAVLMTKLPGETILSTAGVEERINEMAKVLAAIHEVEPEKFAYEHFNYNDALRLEKPLWSKMPDEWLRAFFIVAGVRPAAQPRFIHRDYHPANVLWQEGEIVGVVDWVNACIGPAGVDVGHCRVNLAQLYGVSAADEFLQAYMQHAGDAFQYDPYWDLLSLTDILDGPPKVYGGWTALGMEGLSDELVRHRLDEYLLSLLERFDG